MNMLVCLTEDIDLKNRLILLNEEISFPVPDSCNFTPRSIILIDISNLNVRAIMEKISQAQKKECITIVIYQTITETLFEKLFQRGILSFVQKQLLEKNLPAQLRRALRILQLQEKVKKQILMEKKLQQFIANLDLLISSGDFETKLKRIIQSLKHLLQLDGLCFYIFCNDHLLRRKAVSRQMQTLFPACFNLQTSEKIKERALSGKKITLHHLNLKPDKGLIFPIHKESEFFGLLIVFPPDHSWQAEERKMLESFVKLITILLNNCRIIQYFLMSQEKIINQEREELLNQVYLSLNHELKNPLTVISLETELMQMNLAKRNDLGTISRRLNNIENSIERIKTTLENLGKIKTEKLNLIDYLNGKKMIDLKYEN